MERWRFGEWQIKMLLSEWRSPGAFQVDALILLMAFSAPAN